MMTLNLNVYQKYFDEESKQPLDLCFDPNKTEVDNIVVRLRNVPLLKNPKTGKIYYPNKTKHLVAYFVTEAKKKGHPEISLSPKERRVRYSFAEKYDFDYSHIDYEYIPGLVRPWDEGFLTPVFFNLAVLNKYTQHPEYKLELVSETYGTIFKGDEWYISFGINKNKKVIMWLGDIDKLPPNEIYYLRSENIGSDHDIHSEFYDSQIDSQFSDPSAQSTVFHQRNDLNQAILDKYGFDLYTLEGEISQILENLNRPVFWEDKYVGPFIEALNRIFVESLNTSGLRKDIDTLKKGLETKSQKGLKLFQLWLAERVNILTADNIMTPFFVLYDFRVMLSHLLSKERKAEMHESISSRLCVQHDEGNYENLYNALIKAMHSSYKTILETINPEGVQPAT